LIFEIIEKIKDDSLTDDNVKAEKRKTMAIIKSAKTAIANTPVTLI